MLPTFVIGLREGLEAALIVGIVAAFLKTRGRSDLLRWVFAGIAAAIGLCLLAGAGLELVSRQLPQRQQEGLETVIGALAVLMVSYMVIWMKRHSRDLKGQLEGAAGQALAAGSGWALVAMAFLAVFREGLETVVFLLAAFNEAGSGALAGVGAVLGILVAVGLGWGLYRGGLRLNLSKFFRATGVVLVLVAAGLVMNSAHTAHEAGWLDVGQQRTLDLTAVMRPGSVQASLLTGVLGLQPRPVLIELLGWLVYLVPMGLYVAWPPGRAPSRATVTRWSLSGAAIGGAAAIALVVLVPSAPATRPVTTSPAATAQVVQVVSASGPHAVIRAAVPAPSTSGGTGTSSTRTLTLGPEQDLATTRTGSQQRTGLPVDVFISTQTLAATGGPSRLSYAEVAQLNGGRLPLGTVASSGSVAARYADTDTETFWVARSSGRIIDARWQQVATVTASLPRGDVPLAGEPVTIALDSDVAAAAQQAADHDHAVLDRRQVLAWTAIAAGMAAVAMLLTGAGLAVAGRRGGGSRAPTPGQIPGVRPS